MNELNQFLLERRDIKMEEKFEKEKKNDFSRGV